MKWLETLENILENAKIEKNRFPLVNVETDLFARQD